MSDSEELWDQASRRLIRTQQREIINDVHKNREDMTPEELLKNVQKLDKLMDKVVATKEAAIDAEGFRLLSTIGREQVEQTHGSLIQFEASTYAEKLVTYMGGRRGLAAGKEGIGHLDWDLLGNRAAKAFNLPPDINFLYGALEHAPVKKRKANAPHKRNKEALAKGVTPKEVQNLKDEEESTTKDVQHIMLHAARGCRTRGRLGYFHFLVDPESFAHTVENMFHFSFLVKDGRMGVTFGADGIPYIYLPSDKDESGQSTKQTKNQVIVSLTIEDWKRAIEKFDITEASIPPRPQT